jgi:hypothetical protein
MNAHPSGELAQFPQFISEQILRDDRAMSPEEGLDLWRRSNPVSDEYEETVAALREAFADVAAGDAGMTLGEFDRQFRSRHRPSPTA